MASRHASQQTKRVFRAARVQNEFAPENVLNRYEKRFEKREKSEDAMGGWKKEGGGKPHE